MKHKGMPGKGTSEKEGKAWGHGQYANMPQETKTSMYPKNRGQGGSIDDTMTGIDKSISQAESQSSRHLSSQH
mgnify:FL=1